MAEIFIRNATCDDCPALLEFIRELARYEKLESEVVTDVATLQQSLFGPRPYAHALLAEVDGAKAGFCIYFYNFSTFRGKPGIYIEDIFVRESYRNLGIGKRFFSAIAQIAKRDQCSRIEWWVLDWNTPALDFYAKMGATPMSEWTVYRLTEEQFDSIE